MTSPFGVARTCRRLERSRAGVSWPRSASIRAWSPARKRGPRTAWSDEELLARIRGVLAASLLAPTRARRVWGPRVHDGTTTTSPPNVRWGTDATSVWAEDEGVVTVFAAMDHCTADASALTWPSAPRASRRSSRFARGGRAHFGGFAKGVSQGLELRYDHGSQSMSDHLQGERTVLGIESTPAFVRAPEGNGCIERCFRTLKEQLLWIRSLRNAEDVRLAVAAWVRVYNEQW